MHENQYYHATFSLQKKRTMLASALVHSIKLELQAIEVWEQWNTLIRELREELGKQDEEQ